MPQMTLPPTSIDDYNRIDLVGSVKHINITHTASFDQAEVKLWIWSGDLDLPYTTDAEPNYTLVKDKVSVSDSYITYELSDYIKPFIDPSLLFGTYIATSNEGVYYQYQTRLFSSGSLIGTQTFPTRFATLGYNWNYEGEDTFTYNNGSYGFYTTNINKYYSPFIGYSTPSINLSGSLSTTTMVTRTSYFPDTSNLRCAEDQYLIIYLNKAGLWDTFTPNGKVIVSSKIEKDNFARTYRNPLSVNRNLDHQFSDLNLNTRQSYIINTGMLLESMGMLVEEILYSPKVYLVQFKGDAISGEYSITVDSTVYTADTILITVDSDVSTTGTYLTYNQFPVNVTDTDFGRKTRLNNKNKINYNIKFDDSSYKINNIR